MNQPGYISATQLAARWGYDATVKGSGISPSTLRKWRREKKGPAYIQPGGDRGKALYSLETIEAYEREHGITPVGEKAPA